MSEPKAEKRLCVCGHQAADHDWDATEPSYRSCEVEDCDCAAFEPQELSRD